MKSTGVCPREKFSWRRLVAFGGSSLALGGMLLGSASANAAEYDPNLPRVEEVLDTDGSVWKVLIVPRPLYHPGVPQPKHCYVPPIPAPAAKPMIEAPAPSETTEPEKKEDETKDAPADAQKAPDGQAILLEQTEAIAIQEAEEKPKEEEPKAAEPMPPAPAEEHPFGVEIVPRFSYSAASPSEACCNAHEAPVHIDPANYGWIYSHIPFLRSEYIANPSYRHEATMEILFGEQRPTVVHKHPGQPRPHETQFPYENDIIRPYSYYSQGPGAGYGRGPLPYGAPGAYGVNYNFYYPMPTVYRSY